MVRQSSGFDLIFLFVLFVIYSRISDTPNSFISCLTNLSIRVV